MGSIRKLFRFQGNLFLQKQEKVIFQELNQSSRKQFSFTIKHTNYHTAIVFELLSFAHDE